MSSPYMAVILNLLWFQVCWFACVMIGNSAAMVIVLLVMLGYLAVPALRSEIWLLASMVVLGLVVDMLLINTGILMPPGGAFHPPFWLSVLWLVFATTLNHSLKPLLKKRMLFLLLAVVGGPLSYKIGVALSDVQFGYHTVWALTVLAAVWLFAGYAILILFNRWQRYAAS